MPVDLTGDVYYAPASGARRQRVTVSASAPASSWAATEARRAAPSGAPGRAVRTTTLRASPAHSRRSRAAAPVSSSGRAATTHLGASGRFASASATCVQISQ